MNEDAVPIPESFQLRSDAAAEPSGGIFAMRSVPANSNAWDKLWVWQPEAVGCGFRGELV
jgi:hypothetical protein